MQILHPMTPLFHYSPHPMTPFEKLQFKVCCTKMCSTRASPKPFKMRKSLSFWQLRPLDPRRGDASGPHQGPLSGPLDPTPLYALLTTLAPLTGHCLFSFYCPTNDFGVATRLLQKTKLIWSKYGHDSQCGGQSKHTIYKVKRNENRLVHGRNDHSSSYSWMVHQTAWPMYTTDASISKSMTCISVMLDPLPAGSELD